MVAGDRHLRHSLRLPGPWRPPPSRKPAKRLARRGRQTGWKLWRGKTAHCPTNEPSRWLLTKRGDNERAICSAIIQLQTRSLATGGHCIGQTKRTSPVARFEATSRSCDRELGLNIHKWTLWSATHHASLANGLTVPQESAPFLLDLLVSQSSLDVDQRIACHAGAASMHER